MKIALRHLGDVAAESGRNVPDAELFHNVSEILIHDRIVFSDNTGCSFGEKIYQKVSQI